MKRPEKLSKLRYASPSKLSECVRKKESNGKQKFINHKLAEGETVYRLSRIYNTSVEEIIILNNIQDINDIPAGTNILIENKSDIWKLSWPLKGIITSRFGKRNGKFHYGVDIAAKIGTKIRSASDGVVILSGSNIDGFGGYGKVIILQHSKNILSVYAHNNRNYVSEGLCVREGEVIGEVGSTGNSTGPHLHFEIRKNKEPIDPTLFLN
ncbi:MAG: peptidoglycan DD-metalloendopeptidase family protein [Thermodesulfobacteriota bacterium]